MHKVYLLLRNNKKQGPYSLEELLQQNLKPFDLVWVEGKSVGWKYPTEIEVLKLHVAEPLPTEAKLPDPMPAAVAKKSEPVFEIQTSSPPHASRPVVKNQNVFVSLPAGRNSLPRVSEEESFSKKLEKKAEE